MKNLPSLVRRMSALDKTSLTADVFLWTAPNDLLQSLHNSERYRSRFSLQFCKLPRNKER